MRPARNRSNDSDNRNQIDSSTQNTNNRTSNDNDGDNQNSNENESRPNRFGLLGDNPFGARIGDPLFTTSNGMRAVSSTVPNDDGSISRIINIGVPRDHPLADPNSPAGPSGLHNLRIGPIRLPIAPTFIIRVRRMRNPNYTGPPSTDQSNPD